MKKVNIIFLSVLALGTTVLSCGKEDPISTIQDPASIEGKWIYDSYSFTDKGKTGEPVLFYDATCDDNSYLYLQTHGVLEEGHVNASTDQAAPCALNISTGTWNAEGQVLTIVNVKGAMQYPIVSLTSKKLAFKFANPMNPAQYYTFTLKR